ncbi:MAG: arylesterase [Lachnospiraceae bacterium]|nr:arylesterase [Lachnospiraceae bacterium]
MEQILCFGDSNTYGLIPGTGQRYDWNIRWTGILNDEISRKGFRVVEEGLCGRTTVFEDPFRKGRKGTDILPVLLETHGPVHTVVLMLGTNDCKRIYDASPQIIGKGIEILIGQIQEKSPESKIVLVSPIFLGEKVWEEGFDPEFDAGSVAVSKELGEVYNKIAKEKGTYFLAASSYAKPSAADREHLDEEGHRSLADGLINLFEEIL